MRKIIIACSILVILHEGVTAQQFGIEFNGGLQGLRYQLHNGQGTLQPAGALGLNYTFPFSKHLGLITGIGGSYFSTKATLQDGAVFSSYQADDAGSAFQYDIKPTGYREHQHFFAAVIPVLLQYHTAEKTQWYLDAGAKAFFPFGAKVSASAEQLALSGYYPDYNIEVKDLPRHGFGTVNNWQSTNIQSLRLTATASAASGISFRLSDYVRLYTGIYIDYGLNDMRKSGNGLSSTVVGYNPTNVNAAQTEGVLNISSSARLLAYGLQIRLSFGHEKIKPAPSPQPVPSPQPAPEAVAVVPTPAVTPKVQPAPQPVPPPQKTTPEPQVVATLTPTEETVMKRPIGFNKIGNTAVLSSMMPHLDSIAVILSEYPALRVAIIGHTCNIGTEKVNRRIGEERAEAVASYLEAKGISRQRMDISSVGESDPLVSNTSERNRRLNRRVVIRIE